ncbi:hypothetical protein PRIPAC_78461 [Pristionchus pacificus]|uniref:Uncharacterized protein n=1 Tax=Pristionchus pacificus TaxID=54126 RepID=A0A2A6CPR5_PRIPA|nr:hypothetical protein PRIPAC_78461 [Pristionchus pacificus]|eukprot:PDM80110.1 hypothetical protein PRIPAC_32689 [Pristionchus pacificus]
MAALPYSYVLFNYFGFFLHLGYISTAIFLIVVVHKSQLHSNCKFLLSIWGVSYMAQFVAHAAMYALNTTIDALPINRRDPALRSLIIDLSVSSQLMCECFEIMIASERILSSINPAAYHVSGRNALLWIPLTVLSTFASFLMWCITEANYHVALALGVCAAELCSLTMNNAAVKYCGRRFTQLYGNAQLNAQYQVKEAYQLAVSMQRSYLITFFAKNTFNGIILATCYKIDANHICIPLLFHMPHHILEMLYITGFTSCSNFLLASLLYNHPRLRLKALMILAKIRGSTRVHDAFQPPHFESLSDAYFGDLRRFWD